MPLSETRKKEGKCFRSYCVGNPDALPGACDFLLEVVDRPVVNVVVDGTLVDDGSVEEVGLVVRPGPRPGPIAAVVGVRRVHSTVPSWV